MIEKTRRIRSKAHLKFVGERPCCVCGHRPVDVHHLLQCPDPKARGLKAGDNWTAPLCHAHHMALHLYGFEREWAQGLGIDLVATARDLWRRSPAYRHG